MHTRFGTAWHDVTATFASSWNTCGIWRPWILVCFTTEIGTRETRTAQVNADEPMSRQRQPQNILLCALIDGLCFCVLLGGKCASGVHGPSLRVLGPMLVGKWRCFPIVLLPRFTQQINFLLCLRSYLTWPTNDMDLRPSFTCCSYIRLDAVVCLAHSLPAS